MEGGERGEEGWGRKGGRGRVGEEGGKNAACKNTCMKVRGGTCMLPTVSLDSPEDVGIGCSSSQLQELDMCTGIIHSN